MDGICVKSEKSYNQISSEICKLINAKMLNYRFFLRKTIAACSKFAVTVAITTICYWMRIHKEKNNIFFDFPIF